MTANNEESVLPVESASSDEVFPVDPGDSAPHADNAAASTPSLRGSVFLNVLLLLLVVITSLLAMIGYGIRKDLECLDDLVNFRWEYRILMVQGAGYDRLTSPESFNNDLVVPSQDELCDLGLEGWELVACTPQMETAFPNFGNEDYVTGIRDNIRPQALVLILRRRLPAD